MRRADRLFRIVQLLRGGRLMTAARLAGALEVSERTIYRDMVDLQASGVPIDGAAGAGYILRKGYDLPPLMFTREEIVSLAAGAALIKAWGGVSMARAAEEALIKIEAVLPEPAQAGLRASPIHARGFRPDAVERTRIDLIEQAAAGRRVVGFAYVDESGAETRREIRPLGLWFWGGHWTAVGWCLLRDDFRMFRLARMRDPAMTGATFKAEPGKTLRDFYQAMEREGSCPPASS